jgi:4-hydroxybenzoate polyprenyltransferase
MTTATALRLPRLFARLVRLEHTVFALPFAYSGAFLAWGGVPPVRLLLWITVAMIGARTLAMGLNRLIDASIDAHNPRTASRELPAGTLSRSQVAALCAIALAAYLVAVFRLDPVVRWLWPIPVALFVVYPYLKRVTWLCHLWLGLCTGLAPTGAWIATTGRAPWEAWVLGAAQGVWVAGFDLFYALFDVEHDRRAGLHSWATRFGETGVFAGARSLHAIAVALLVAVGLGLGLGVWYWLGTAAVAGLLVYEHRLVRPGDLRRLNAAFFTVNGIIALVFFVFVLFESL